MTHTDKQNNNSIDTQVSANSINSKSNININRNATNNNNSVDRLPSFKLPNSMSSIINNNDTNTTKNSSSLKKTNLLLSTSFISTRKFDNSLPTSPLQPRLTINKKKETLKYEIDQIELELLNIRKRKEDTERFRHENDSNNFVTTGYSTDHIQKHSMRIKTNTQIREMDKQIKKLDKQLFELKEQYNNLLKRSNLNTNSNNIQPNSLSLLNNPNINLNITNNNLNIDSNFNSGNYNSIANYLTNNNTGNSYGSLNSMDTHNESLSLRKSLSVRHNTMISNDDNSLSGLGIIKSNTNNTLPSLVTNTPISAFNNISNPLDDNIHTPINDNLNPSLSNSINTNINDSITRSHMQEANVNNVIQNNNTVAINELLTNGNPNVINVSSSSNTSDDSLISNELNNSINFNASSNSRNTAFESATWHISDYMESLQETDVSEEFILNKANAFIITLDKYPQLRKDLVLDSFLTTLQQLLLSENKLIISAAYRICRHLINDQEFVYNLIKMKIEIFIIMSLAKDNSFQMEREQALKLIRKMSEFENGITKGMLQAVISCIEKTDDSLRIIAVETLLETCFTNPELVSDCQGINVLEELLQNSSSFSLMSIVFDTLLTLITNHQTRKYILRDFDITVLATPFTDINIKKSANIEKLQNTKVLITKALKDNNGFLLYTMNNFKPIKQLLSFFQIPICAHYLIDIFLDVLRIKPLSPKEKIKRSNFKLVPSNYLKDATSINQSVALVLQVLNKCNFQDYLSDLVNSNLKEEFTSSVIMKGRYLFAEYINLRMNLLNICNLPRLTRLFCDTKSLKEETFEFSKMITMMNKNRNTIGMEEINYKDISRLYAMDVRENTLVSSVDDLKFRKMVYDSRVLQTKDFSQWNWNIIEELFEGPLMNKKQLEELVKSTKFVRRILVFYRPLRLRFSNVKLGTRLCQKYIQAGCKFFKTLTTNPEGMRILADDNKIIPQLASLLFRAMEGETDGNIFNEETLQTKAVYGYFKFIGVLTQSNFGVEILTRWNFFTVIYKMFQFESRIGLKFLLLILPELDLAYSIHCRIIIGKTLVAPEESLRIKATSYVGEKLKNLLKHNSRVNADEETRSKLQKFKLEMLTRQLYDLSPKVVAIADRALYDCIIDNTASLKIRESFRTFLNQMIFIRSPILFELLGKSYGFQILNEINFVEQERRMWLTTKNIEYVTIVNKFLSDNKNKFRKIKNVFEDRKDKLPIHFYGSLANTEGGITMLSQSGDLIKFINILKNYTQYLYNNRDYRSRDYNNKNIFEKSYIGGKNMTSYGKDNNNTNKDNGINIIEIESALWCCGHIGSTELGIGLLDNYSTVEDMIQISYQSNVISIKFAAFYCLGLIGYTREGCEILDEMGWSSCISVDGKPMGIALPTELDKFLTIHDDEDENETNYDNDHDNIDYYETSLNDINNGNDSEDIKNYDDDNDEEDDDDIISIDYNLGKLLSEKDNIENSRETADDTESTIQLSTVYDKNSEERVKKQNITENKDGRKKEEKEKTPKERELEIETEEQELEEEKEEKEEEDCDDEEEETGENNNASDKDKLNQRITETISQLSNHILSNGAIKKMTDYNNKYGQKLFEDEEIFYSVIKMMEQYRFKPQVRKFLCGIIINARIFDIIIKSEKRIINDK